MFTRALLLLTFLLGFTGLALADSLPFNVVFKGRDKFDRLVQRAETDNWKSLPIGERTTAVGRSLLGTPYKSFTLEIDDRIEAPSVNLNGLDCWTFFEAALGFARMLDQPRENWTPESLLREIERDRYRGGRCTGEYLSRLHYLEDWADDNDQRGLVQDLTRSLGGSKVAHEAHEMTVGWKQYRYLRARPSLLPAMRSHEERVSRMTMYHIPKSQVGGIEPKLQNGDIIGITSRDGRKVATSHVGLALRGEDGVLRFMHASSPRNHGKVIIDSRLKDYLFRYGSHTGIIVVRPMK